MFFKEFLLQDLKKYAFPESPCQREVQQIIRTLCRGLYKASFADTTAHSSFFILPFD